MNLRILSRKSELLTVGVCYVEGFYLSLVLICVLSDHVDTSRMTLYCSQLTGCYEICKSAENGEHFGY